MQATYDIRPDIKVIKAVLLLCLGIYGHLIIIYFLTPDQRYVAIPALVLVDIAILSLAVLWKRDGVFPFFEIGTQTIVAMLAYSAIPLVMYLLAGMTWNVFSDARLFCLDATPPEMGAMAWRYVIYLLSFAIAYLIKRGDISALSSPLKVPDRSLIISIVSVILMILVFCLIILVTYDYNFWHTYEDIQEVEDSLKKMPLLVQQLSIHFFEVFNFLKLGLVIILVQHWHQKRWRYLLYIWLLAELLVTVTQMGKRIYLVFLVMSVPLVYHRFVKPLKFSAIALVGCIMLVGVMAYGYLRDFYQDTARMPTSILTIDRRVFAMSNDFQVLYGNVYHMHHMKQTNSLGDVPLAMRFADIFRLIPQQLLPFKKVEPSGWYLERLNLQGKGLGMMFGGISEAVIGLDWIELVWRGAVLGFIFALIHRWYVRRSSSFWITLIYLFLCLFSFYTVRASTFYFVGVILQQAIISVLLVKFTTILFSVGRKVAMAQAK